MFSKHSIGAPARRRRRAGRCRAVIQSLEPRLLLSTYNLSTLVTFNGANGSYPYDALVPDSSGNLYGVTDYGGTAGHGTIFELPKGSSTVKTLINFNGANGSNPFGAMTIDSKGDLFGTTSYG